MGEEEERKAKEEEERLAREEEERKAEEERLAREEEERKAEEARLAKEEEDRKAQIAEEERKAEEDRKAQAAEEERKAEEAKKAQAAEEEFNKAKEANEQKLRNEALQKEEVKEGEDILTNDNQSRVVINAQNIEEKDKNIDNINTNFSHSQKNQPKEEIKVDNMMLNDKIDINSDNEQVAQQRKINNKKNDQDVVKKERKGFCTSCTIF